MSFSLNAGETRTFQEILAAASENSAETTDDWLLAQMLQQDIQVVYIDRRQAKSDLSVITSISEMI